MKQKRIKKETYRSEDQTEAIRLVWILVIIIVFVIGIYLFTRLFVTKDLFKKDEDNDVVTPGEINYQNVIIGTMLSKPEDEYFVMIMDNSLPNSVYYTGLINNYSRNTDALNVYYADLKSELNKNYIGTENNISDNLENFKVSKNTLIRVKNGKIANSYTTDEELEKVLKYVEEE